MLMNNAQITVTLLNMFFAISQMRNLKRTRFLGKMPNSVSVLSVFIPLLMARQNASQHPWTIKRNSVVTNLKRVTS